MIFGDLLISLFYVSLFLVTIFVGLKIIEYRNKSRQKWDELDDKIEEMRKTIAEELE